MILTRLLGGGEPDREADGEGGVGPPAQRGHRHQARAGQQLVLVTPVHALHSTVQYTYRDRKGLPAESQHFE